MSAVDSSGSDSSRVCWAGNGGEKCQSGNGCGEQDSDRLRSEELNAAEHSQAQQSGRWAVWLGQSGFQWFVCHCFPLSWAQGWETLAVGASPTACFCPGGTHRVWEWLPLCLCLEKHMELAVLEQLPSCPCPRGPHGHDLQGLSTILSLSQRPHGTKLRWWTPFCG